MQSKNKEKKLYKKFKKNIKTKLKANIPKQ